MKWFNRQKNILFLGLYSCGKTSIIYSFVYNHPILTIPTLGAEHVEIKIKNKKITCIDITGQIISVKLWKYYYDLSDAVVYVIDINNLVINTQQEVNTLRDVIENYDKNMLIVLTKYLHRSQENIEDIKNTLLEHLADLVIKRKNSISIINYDIKDKKNESLKSWLITN